MGAEATVRLPTQSNEVHHEVEWVVALDRGNKTFPKMRPGIMLQDGA